MVGNPEVIQKRACGKHRQVKALSPHHRFVIALHSPDKVTETGLRMCIQRKASRLTPFNPEQFVLSSPLYGGNIAKYRHILRISRQKSGQFLCGLDLLAERMGFEPSIPFLRCS
jgi:hypothetical protein